MTQLIVRDYAESGLTIREAMLEHVKRYPDKRTRPEHILWGSLHVKTSDVFSVSKRGIVRAEILSSKGGVEQGFDLEVDGWFELAHGEHVPLLRTWKDARLEDIVEYRFFTGDGRLWVWNVFKMVYAGGQVVEEKWTENAGFWIEQLSQHERIYHCSHGMANPPDFDSLIFKVKVSVQQS